MIDLKKERSELQSELGYLSFSKIWAKIEMLLGLLMVVIAIFWIVQDANRAEELIKISTFFFAPGIGFLVLGGYLVLSGHRSHLYQTWNDHSAYLLKQIRELKDKD